MKRLLALLVVIYLTPSANAALLISANGIIDVPFAEISLEPTQTAVIGIHGDGGAPHAATAYLLVEGPGSIDGHTMIYRGSLSEYQDFPWDVDGVPVPPLEELQRLRELLGRPDLVDLSMITFADGVVPPLPLDGLLVDDIILRCDAVGDITLSLISDDLQTIYDTQGIQQVPEPVSLLLLGLGGLLLARKRHAVSVEWYTTPSSGVHGTPYSNR